MRIFPPALEGVWCNMLNILMILSGVENSEYRLLNLLLNGVRQTQELVGFLVMRGKEEELVVSVVVLLVPSYILQQISSGRRYNS
ncbi:hypothetical protein OGM63_02245 [Plectonema radiosum NIES-515]|uniref:Uncharacterized protein n=1 Tax=Plectonema radiosum NIES-515 TaxID=2986073 RepID=A0ABT3ATC5_9CYAN|nr:hypothetical protein [Plectonema radiosum]MCV3212360.1 hypothetical protein [Plectonema radiosum NIES-515]